MTTYQGRITREQGASVLSIASGGSVNFDAGAVLSTSGTFVVASASALIGDAASLILKPAATTQNAAYPFLNLGQNQMWYSPGSAGSPITAASPGDMMWIANSASTSFWFNVSNGTGGSVWKLSRLNTGSQIPTGP